MVELNSVRYRQIRRRLRRQREQPTVRERRMGLLLLAGSVLYICFIMEAEVILDTSSNERRASAPFSSFENSRSVRKVRAWRRVEEKLGLAKHLQYNDMATAVKEHQPKKFTDLKELDIFNPESESFLDRKFFLFQGFLPGQGIGNAMLGLLATHLLGKETDRIVCINDSTFSGFRKAFEPINSDVLRLCPLLHATLQANEINEASLPAKFHMSLCNFGPPIDECRLKKRLSVDDIPLYIVKSNTYPRWPSNIPNDFFNKHYTPTQALLNVLPWKDPPSTVVHLRDADDPSNDVRKGVSEAAFEALGQLESLNEDDYVYLVTNRVAWYSYFSEVYGWRHPPWKEVIHSALGLSWGDSAGDMFPSKRHAFQVPKNVINETLQNLQLWADWYTIARAEKTVLHTYSDFSQSAVLWQSIRSSRIIGDFNETSGTISLTQETWRRFPATIGLMERSDLQNCRPEQHNYYSASL